MTPEPCSTTTADTVRRDRAGGLRGPTSRRPVVPDTRSVLAPLPTPSGTRPEHRPRPPRRPPRRERDPKTLRRIKFLVIPPAWSAVWISPDPLGHLQVTGRDRRGRKQYRYHARWIGEPPVK